MNCIGSSTPIRSIRRYLTIETGILSWEGLISIFDPWVIACSEQVQQPGGKFSISLPGNTFPPGSCFLICADQQSCSSHSFHRARIGHFLTPTHCSDSVDLTIDNLAFADKPQYAWPAYPRPSTANPWTAGSLALSNWMSPSWRIGLSRQRQEGLEDHPDVSPAPARRACSCDMMSRAELLCQPGSDPPSTIRGHHRQCPDEEGQPDEGPATGMPTG